MRIGEITNSAKYQMYEQNQNFRIFGMKLWFSKLKKKFPNFNISKIIKFPLVTNSKKIIKVLKLLNFKKQQISSLIFYNPHEFFQFFLTVPFLGGGQNLQRPNVERTIFRKFETSNIERKNVELFDFFIFKFISYIYVCLNRSNTQNI